MEVGLPGACEYWWHEWPVDGLSANKIAGALISMMARSTKALQCEAGYIDARPLPPTRRNSLRRTADHTFVPIAAQRYYSITSPARANIDLPTREIRAFIRSSVARTRLPGRSPKRSPADPCDVR